MVVYALFTMVFVQEAGLEVIKWNPEPLSIHATYKECENAYNDLSGFPRRAADTEKLMHNALLKCKRINNDTHVAVPSKG